MLPELALVVSALKQANRTSQRLGGAGKAAALSGQTGQVMPEVGVGALDQVGLALTGRHLVSVLARVHHVVVGRAVVRKVEVGLGHGIDQLLGFFPGKQAAYSKAQKTAGHPVYHGGEEEELPFF